MRRHLILASTCIAALAGAPALVGSAAAADMTVSAAGMTVFKVPGMGNCNSPTTIQLKTSGADFGFAALLQGGENGTNPCSLVNIHMAYTSQTPVQRICTASPVGATGVIQGPASFVVKKVKATKKTPAQTQHIVEFVVKDCSGNTIRMTNTMVLSAGSVHYTFEQYVNKVRNLVATGTLTRAPGA